MATSDETRAALEAARQKSALIKSQQQQERDRQDD